ncbi:MAG: hypothetical protein CEO12_424 [Parcubacteria group bacterium Gr01-1014_46]|nr:MAG: hypothetical protein CEO12_424 [Parcubacteria group bacterium Gr01-1014_46]
MLNTKKSASIALSVFITINIIAAFYCVAYLYPVFFVLLIIQIYLLLKTLKQFNLTSFVRISLASVVGTLLLLLPLIVTSLFGISCPQI